MDNHKTISGLPKLSGDFNRGYTQAIQDLIEIFEYIQPDLKHYHKNLNGKLSLLLLKCCLKYREKIRDKHNGFIRFNHQKQNFEWFELKERK